MMAVLARLAETVEAGAVDLALDSCAVIVAAFAAAAAAALTVLKPPPPKRPGRLPQSIENEFDLLAVIRAEAEQERRRRQ